MNSRFSAPATQLLIILNVFIVFLLAFESKLVIPAWLQPVGRMHPLILHFPIVLLVMAMLLEFFRFRKDTSDFYRNLAYYLLLSGAILAGITVIMGLLLSREEGYTGDTLQWHKWTGAGIFFIASIIYFVRNASWYKAPFAKGGALLMVIGLILTGHYGATLTHGDDFILQPLAIYSEPAAVPFDQAIAFEHVIKPIFEKKCASCHNPDKLKGELMLTDSASVVKGGKSGKLFVPGNPDISLLLERVHLPAEDKKHMPPTGKAQLTPTEIAILAAWIKEGATYFSQKVATLPANDSFRVLAAAFLQPVQTVEEKYAFAPANEETVHRLNTDYRTIAPIAIESPALSVNMYNREAYTHEQLAQLAEIKQNIVSLNLNKLPITDEDIKTIKQFDNLRHLYLNFTDVTANGLKELSSLPYLSTLAISGTKLNFQDVKGLIPSLKKLQTISIWNTQTTAQEATQLQQANKSITFIAGFSDDGTDPLKLNPPQVKNNSMVFTETMPLELRHPVKGVDIRFTTDGTEPDSIKSPLFDNNVVLKANTFVKARGYKKGWYSSDVADFGFFKSIYKPDSVRLLYKLNSVHQAQGASTFFDTKLGVIGANNPAWANNWAGVRSTDMGIVALFDKPINISSVGMHYMLEAPTGIYPPGSVEVWGGQDEAHLKLLTTFKAPLPVKGEKPTLKIIEGSFKPHMVSCLKVVAKPHIQNNNRYLLLVDEMFFN